jgi:glycosyltransferase involved in cell wall biosynthesis
MSKFSIIIPVYSELDANHPQSSGQRHYRAETIQRAIKSVMCQQFPDWELILVDDGCADGVTPNLLDSIAKTHNKWARQHSATCRIKVIHKKNQNRAIARNTGMDAATGDWICWLDSDDEYSSHYLRQVDYMIREHPEYKIFNFGSILYWPDRTTTRETFKPEREGDGHVWFKSGQIGSGSFVFRRDLWAGNQSAYRIPDEENPYQFAASSRFDLRLPEDQPDIDNPSGAFTDGVYRHGLSLGNPWGDDALQFFLLTRDNYSFPMDDLLYIQYPRAHEDVYEHFGAVYDPADFK